jgi:serine/threonine-protein kinase
VLDADDPIERARERGRGRRRRRRSAEAGRRDAAGSSGTTSSPKASATMIATPTSAHAAAGAGGGRTAKRKRRRRASRWVAAVLLVAALATLGLLGVSLVRDARGPKLFVVPNVEGVDAGAVAALLPPKSDWHVEYLPDQRRDGTHAGQILDQDPNPDEKLRQGGVLRLTRSAGEALRPVPDLAGVAQEQATAQLQALGLQVDAQPAYDEQIGAGAVIRVEQRGQQVEKGSTVTLVVSQGPAPRQIPDLAGQAPDAAKAALQAKGLVPADGQDYSETVDKGKVIGTDPPAGQSVARDSTVTVVVSLGRRPIPVPDDLVGKSPTDAADELEALGLVVRTDGAPNKPVIATDPGPGKVLYRGDQIIIITQRT